MPRGITRTAGHADCRPSLGSSALLQQDVTGCQDVGSALLRLHGAARLAKPKHSSPQVDVARPFCTLVVVTVLRPVPLVAAAGTRRRPLLNITIVTVAVAVFCTFNRSPGNGKRSSCI